MREILFARPHQLDRTAHDLRGPDGLCDEILLDLAAQAAAQHRGRHADPAGIQAGDLRRCGHHARLSLGGCPDTALGGGDFGRAAEHFHAGVGQVGQLVGQFERPLIALQHAGRIAVANSDGGCAAGHQVARASGDRDTVHLRRIGRLGPAHGHFAGGFESGPGAGRHDGHRVAQIDHRQRTGRLRRSRLDRAAKDRALFDDGVKHAGDPDIQSVDGAAVDLGGQVDARQAAADQPARRSRGHGGRSRQTEGRGRGGELAITRAERRAGDGDPAICGHAAGCRDLEDAGSGQDQQFAGRRASLAQRVVIAADAVAAPGQLQAAEGRIAEDRAGRRVFGAHLRPGRPQFVADHLREAGQHALTHVAAADKHGHQIVAGDPDPCLHGRPGWTGGIGAPRDDRQADTQQQASAGGRLHQEAPPPGALCARATTSRLWSGIVTGVEQCRFEHGGRGHGQIVRSHRSPPQLPAARWIAARIRW